jgi:L-asparaginase
MQKILLIITGGTIDSVYSPTQDTVVPNTQSVIPAYINDIKPYFDIRIEILCMKDSRNISNLDREKMVNLIKESDEPYVLITHGTYTLPDTARYIETYLNGTDKTVVLT